MKKAIVVGILAVQALIAHAGGEMQGTAHGKEETESFGTGTGGPEILLSLEAKLGRELRAAITNNDVAAVRRYLEVGVDANYKDDNGMTPLGEAISDIESGNPWRLRLVLRITTKGGMNILDVSVPIGVAQCGRFANSLAQVVRIWYANSALQ